MKAYNLTQHIATSEQIENGIIEPNPEVKEKIKKLLTFDKLPTIPEMQKRAKKLMKIIESEFKDEYIMIGGAPYFMSILEDELIHWGYTPIYSFSKRVSKEIIMEDGTVKKINEFKHVGFVEVY